MLLLLIFLQRFLQRFIDPTSNEDENAGLDLNEPLYMQKLEEVGSPICDTKTVINHLPVVHLVFGFLEKSNATFCLSFCSDVHFLFLLSL